MCILGPKVRKFLRSLIVNKNDQVGTCQNLQRFWSAASGGKKMGKDDLFEPSPKGQRLIQAARLFRLFDEGFQT